MEEVGKNFLKKMSETYHMSLKKHGFICNWKHTIHYAHYKLHFFYVMYNY
jgi:hypothetical protein